MKGLFRVSGAVCAVCLLGIILISGVFLPSFGMWFYYRQFEVNDTYAVLNVEPEDLHVVVHHMIGYLRGVEDDLQIETVVGGRARPFFSDIEIRHMVDVRNLVVIASNVRTILIVLLVFSLVPLLGLRDKAHRNMWVCFLKSMQYVSAIIFGLVSVLVVIISLNWNRAWWVFHEIFFNNDYWILDPRVDLLINIVPYPFFFAMSVFIGVFFGVGLVFVFAGSTLLLRRFGKLASGR